jgi:DNA-binding NarL/FixJ family response regulator
MRIRVTLADDDATSVYLLERLLAYEIPGSEVVSFADANDAFDHIVRNGTDVLVTDHGMGQFSGTDMIRLLRKRNFEAPIIMVSNDSDARDEAYEVGADDFVPKAEIVGKLPEILRSTLRLMPRVIAGRGPGDEQLA